MKADQKRELKKAFPSMKRLSLKDLENSFGTLLTIMEVETDLIIDPPMIISDGSKRNLLIVSNLIDRSNLKKIISIE